MSGVVFQRALSHARARGVSLLTAVFLLVVLATLSAAIVGVFGTQQSASALDVLGARAEQAARSGLEWGLHRQLRPATPSVDCFTAAPVTFALPAGTSLSGFSVTVSCQAVAGNAAANTTNRWTISAVACNQPGSGICPSATPGPDYVQRRVQAELN